MNRSHVAAFLLISAIGVGAVEEPRTLSLPPDVDFDAITAFKSHAEIMASFYPMDHALSDFQTKVIVEIDHPRSDNSFLAAVNYAKDFRLAAAASHLAPKIAFRDEEAGKIPVFDIPAWGVNPVLQAMMEIGSPSIPYLIENLSTSDDPETRRLSGIALGAILNPELARVAVQQQIERPGTPADQIGRLKVALPLLQEPPARATSRPVAGADKPLGLSVPPLQVVGKGYIRTLYRDGNRTTWGVFAAPILMNVNQPKDSTDFEYSFSIEAGRAFPQDGDENVLCNLAAQLLNNPLDRAHSGVANEVIQKLAALTQNGAPLNHLPMNVADAAAKPVEALWVQYAAASGNAHVSIGTAMLDALSSAGNNAIPQNQASFRDFYVKLRQIIPFDQEKAYRQGIQSAVLPPPGG